MRNAAATANAAADTSSRINVGQTVCGIDALAETNSQGNDINAILALQPLASAAALTMSGTRALSRP